MDPQSSIRPAALTANTFTRSGYQFDGWKTAPSSGTAYAKCEAEYPFNARTPENANATLYAQWSQVSAPTITSADATTATQDLPWIHLPSPPQLRRLLLASPKCHQVSRQALPDGVSLMYSSGSSATISAPNAGLSTFTTTISARNGNRSGGESGVYAHGVRWFEHPSAGTPGCANSSVPKWQVSGDPTKAACQTTAGQVVGTRAAGT